MLTHVWEHVWVCKWTDCDLNSVIPFHTSHHHGYWDICVFKCELKIRCRQKDEFQTELWNVQPAAMHWPCVSACRSALAQWPVGPCRWRTGLSGPAPGWRRCAPVTVWQHHCGGSGFPPGSRALRTGAGRPSGASGAPGCTGPGIMAEPALLVRHLGREKTQTDNLDQYASPVLLRHHHQQRRQYWMHAGSKKAILLSCCYYGYIHLSSEPRLQGQNQLRAGTI